MEKKFSINGQEIIVQNFRKEGTAVSFTINGKNFSYELIDRKGSDLVLQGTERFRAHLGIPNRDGETMIISHGNEGIVAEAGKKMKKAAGVAGSLASPMPGKIFKVIKEVGAEVKKGEVILILEAMKMEHSIRSDKDGKVKNIFFKTGELVQGGVALAEVE